MSGKLSAAEETRSFAQPMTGFDVDASGDVVITGSDGEGFATFTLVTYRELQGIAQASRNNRDIVVGHKSRKGGDLP